MVNESSPQIQEEESYHLKSYSRHENLDKHMSNILYSRFGERFVKYRELWAATEKRLTVPEFPLMVEVEPVDGCNFKCGHCYRAHHPGSKNSLDFSKMKKIVDEGCEYSLPSFLVGAGGEALLHPKCIDLVEYALDQGIMDVFLATNASLLKEEDVDRLIGAGLTRLNVSIDASNPDTYRRIRGGSLEKVERIVQYAVDKRDSLGLQLPIIRVSFVVQEENRSEQQAFLDKWKNVVDKVDFQKLLDLSSVHDLSDPQVEEMFCPMPWNRVLVWADGMMSPCCTFHGKHHLYGDITKDTIKSLWDSNKTARLRKMLVDGPYPKSCRNCYGTLGNY